MSEPDPRIAAARDKAFLLYEGKQVPHHSCGICLAATFNLRTQPYQALRRGGITGEGECGAIKAGELILGEYFGNPDPAGTVTDTLRAAVAYYREQWTGRLQLPTGAAPDARPDIVCNHLTAPHGDFQGAVRKQFCTNLAAAVASLVAETLVRFGADFEVMEIERRLVG